MNELEGKTIKRYKIVKELGRGGMAVVYQAIDPMLDRSVAIKLILSENTSREKSERLLKRFNREAKALASLTHPNIVKVLDYGEYEGMPFLVMEYISKGTLRARMGSPIHYAEAAAKLVPVARALQHAHQKRIIHRDIKPENILVNESDQLLLSDFGILKLLNVEESQGLTGTGKIVGTYAYMSPEQIRGQAVDGRTDLYSLGIVFYEMITGRKPYSGGTPIQISMQHLYDPIPKAKQFIRDLPAEVELLIATALAKNPEERYAGMSAFADALEQISKNAAATKSGERKTTKPPEKKSPATPIKKRPAYSLWIPPIIVLIAVLSVFAYLFRDTLAPAFSAPANTPTSLVSAAATKKLPTPSPTRRLPTPTRTVRPTPTLVRPSPTSAKPVIGTGNAQKVLLQKSIDKISVNDMDWIENGNWLIDSGSQKVSFIDVSTSAVNDAPLPGEIPLAMAVSPATAKVYLLFNDKIQVLDINTRKVINTFTPIAGGTRSIAVSPDGKLLALGISNNKTQLLDAAAGNVIRNLKSNYGGWAVAFSPDSKFITSGTSQGVLKWETDTGLWRPIQGGQEELIIRLAISHDGKLLAGGGNNVIYIWNLEDGQQQQKIQGNFGNVNGLDFSPDDSLLVTGTDDGTVRIWNVSNGQSLKELTGHKSQIADVCFSPDGQNIASGAVNDASIRIWGLP
jgi:eukaryotic-like serine/threonine-protein kinase